MPQDCNSSGAGWAPDLSVTCGEESGAMTLAHIVLS
jgi:hypothetical protein